MEPVTTLAAGAIAKIAFDEFVKSGAGEFAKKTVGGAIDLVKNLRDRIRAKFQETNGQKRLWLRWNSKGHQQH
jgi:hypothetical protein